MKLFPIFAIFALFAAQAFAYDIGIKVTVSQDTLAVGTNISIVKDGTLLYSAKADGSGTASFKLDQGSYFVYLDRGGYSRHVNLLEVGKNDNITYTLRQLISYASAYGRMEGPSDFGSASVAAYINGNIAKRATLNKDGYYLMSFMPEGEYTIVFGAPGFVESNVSATLLQSQFSEVDAKLEKVQVAVQTQPTMTVPPAVQRQSVIEVLIVNGSQPMIGQVVSVKTPSGSVDVITGADGKAHVNAVKPGEYVFTYGNLTSKTVVDGAAENATAPKPPVVIAGPAAPQSPVQAQAPADNGIATGIAIVLLIGAIAAVGIILFVMSKLARGQKPHAHEKPEHAKHEHGAAHTHEAHRHGHKK